MNQRISVQQIFMTGFFLLSVALVGLVDILAVDPMDFDSTVQYEKDAQIRALEYASIRSPKILRKVASLGSVKPNFAKDKIISAQILDAEMKSLAFNCRMSLDRQVSKSENSYVQLVGQQCGKIKNFQVINNTNGYTATVFDNVTKGFETDLIQLNAGKNEIEVKMENENGQKISKFIYLHYEKIKNN